MQSELRSDVELVHSTDDVIEGNETGRDEGRDQLERSPGRGSEVRTQSRVTWARDSRLIVKHKAQSKRPTRKLMALRQEARQRQLGSE